MEDKTKLMSELLKAKSIYDEHLLNKDFLYIFKNKITEKIESFEMKCIANNFLHLTGVDTTIKSADFYKRLSENRISLKEIGYKSNGTTRLKLEVFDRIPLLITSPVQVCFQDNFFTLKLRVDILLNRPTINRKDIILGLKQMRGFDFFVPASIIKAEPQKIGRDFSQVLCILEKNRGEKEYSIIRYKAKEIEDIDELLAQI